MTNAITAYINQINYRSGTQFRSKTSMEHVERLAEKIIELEEDGKTIDPIEVIEANDSHNEFAKEYYLTDGFHRFWAQRDKLERKEVEVLVVGKGTLRDAKVKALRANANHQLALARNKGDVKNACEAAAELIKADQLEAGVDEFKVKVLGDEVAALAGLANGNRTANAAASVINKEAKAARDELIVSMLEAGKTQAEIAVAAGCDKNTVRKLREQIEGEKLQDAKIPLDENSLTQEQHLVTPANASPVSTDSELPWNDYDEPEASLDGDSGYDADAEFDKMLATEPSDNGEYKRPSGKKQKGAAATAPREERTMIFELDALGAFNVAAKAYDVFERNDISHEEAVECLKTFPEKRLKEILRNFSEFAEILSDAELLSKTNVTLKETIELDDF